MTLVILFFSSTHMSFVFEILSEIFQQLFECFLENVAPCKDKLYNFDELLIFLLKSSSAPLLRFLALISKY